MPIITLLPDTEDLIDHRVLNFRWRQPTGQPGVDDIAVNQKGRLVISESAWDILQTFHITDYEISAWPPAPPVSGRPG